MRWDVHEEWGGRRMLTSTHASLGAILYSFLYLDNMLNMPLFWPFLLSLDN